MILEKSVDQARFASVRRSGEADDRREGALPRRADQVREPLRGQLHLKQFVDEYEFALHTHTRANKFPTRDDE